MRIAAGSSAVADGLLALLLVAMLVLPERPDAGSCAATSNYPRHGNAPCLGRRTGGYKLLVSEHEQHEHPSLFDRFAWASANLVSRAPFFAFCVALVVIWAPTLPLVKNFDTWQLLINTPTTILTFLLVAVLQNSQRRTEQALQKKLDAIADGLADLMEHVQSDRDRESDDLAQDIRELKKTVGLGE
jgi:hypothetical protein